MMILRLLLMDRSLNCESLTSLEFRVSDKLHLTIAPFILP